MPRPRTPDGLDLDLDALASRAVESHRAVLCQIAGRWVVAVPVIAVFAAEAAGDTALLDGAVTPLHVLLDDDGYEIARVYPAPAAMVTEATR